MTIFLKVLIWCIITAQTTNFENIRITKYTFPAVWFTLRLITIRLLLFLKDFSISNFDFFQNDHFYQIFKLRIILAQTTNSLNIFYVKIYYTCRLVCGETSYNQFDLFFWKIFAFQISIFLKKYNFFQSFKSTQNYSPDY